MSFFHIDIPIFVRALGYSGLALVVFAESGLLFGFFLPGDSLLFSAGLLATVGVFNIWLLILIVAASAIFGDSIGFWFGKKVGPKIFSREDSFFFHRRHLERAKEFYQKYGSRTIVLARFVPIIRTFAPVLAGVADMNYGTFILYNVLGGIVWSVALIIAGYVLGSVVPHAQSYVSVIALVIIMISFLPMLGGFLRKK